MDALTAIKTRKSIRVFEDRPISQAQLKELVRAARAAPSAGNLQSPLLIIVEDREQKRKLYEACYNQRALVTADKVLAVCVDDTRIQPRYGERGLRLYAIQDSAAMTQNILLASHALGLAAVWVGAFDDAEVATTLKLPSHVRPMALIPIGYAAQDPKYRVRIPVEEMLHWDAYGNTEKSRGFLDE